MKATTVAKILVDEIISRHSAPKKLLSDQGRDFLANIVKELCNYFKTKKIQTTPYHPQTNGLTERFNGTLCKMLATYTNNNQTNWDLFLPIVLFAYRTSVQTTTGESPFRLLYGRDPNLPLDLDGANVKSDFIKQIDIAWREAKANIANSGEQSKRIHDERYKQIEYNEGDKVRVWSPATKIGLKTKLRNDIYKGPCTVTRTWPNGNIEIDITSEDVSRTAWPRATNASKNAERISQDQVKQNRDKESYVTRYGRLTMIPKSYEE
jgi:hypothetical protein